MQLIAMRCLQFLDTYLHAYSINTMPGLKTLVHQNLLYLCALLINFIIIKLLPAISEKAFYVR